MLVELPLANVSLNLSLVPLRAGFPLLGSSLSYNLGVFIHSLLKRSCIAHPRNREKGVKLQVCNSELPGFLMDALSMMLGRGCVENI